MKSLKLVAIALLIIGGLNWGLIAAIDLDLVAELFGKGSPFARVVYGAVGASALFKTALLFVGCKSSAHSGCCR